MLYVMSVDLTLGNKRLRASVGCIQSCTFTLKSGIHVVPMSPTIHTVTLCKCKHEHVYSDGTHVKRSQHFYTYSHIIYMYMDIITKIYKTLRGTLAAGDARFPRLVGCFED